MYRKSRRPPGSASSSLTWPASSSSTNVLRTSAAVRPHRRLSPAALRRGSARSQTSFHAGGIARVDVAKTSAQPQAPPTPLPRHRLPLVSATVQNKTIVVLEGDETGEELLEE